ncbi:S8 family peptidase [Enterocloster sp.]|jgi:subtilisin family serine protease|uniref:S8 family peptidase n=1 Tax=Enterocloster sp. TaxID=2719315 RepID=UPI003AEF6093
MPDCPFNPAAENIADLIYRFGSLQSERWNNTSSLCADYVSSDYIILHMPLTPDAVSMRVHPYYMIPSLFSPLDYNAMEASGILSAFNSPALNNQGKGVLIGLVDTGIDYRSPLFQNPDGTTRIAGIWDQSVPIEEDVLPAGVPDYYPMGGSSYGTEYTREQINEALASDDPLSLVPTQDTIGHGTFLAGLAAGSSIPQEDFTGAAPEAELAVVKLKPAKKYLRDFYLIPSDAPAFQENDIMMGIKYLRMMADRLKKPLVILLAMGSNSGSHIGTSPLSQVTQNYSGFFGIITVIAGGNETGAAHHFYASIPAGTEYEDVEIRVGKEEAERGFVLELWAADADTYTVGFISPSGERISRIPIIANNETSIPFLLDATTITVNYQLIEAESGSQLIFMRFQTPAAGIWTVRVYNTQRFKGTFHMWLPVQGMISEETVFLRPDPYSTITVPGNSRLPITVGAYDTSTGGIYIHSSRGFTPNQIVKPELAAPGVNILGPSVGRKPGSDTPMTTRTGTSAAAAITAGAAANLLGWGIVEGNYPTMSEASVKSYLIRGAQRNPALTYPNREFGYGTLDLFQTFLRLRE